MKKILLFFGDQLIGDVNKIAHNRKLSETLKSEAENPAADQFVFALNWQQFKELAARRLDDKPENLLRVGKMRVVFLVDDLVRFSGWLASKPARSGYGGAQMLELKFFEWFARLNGDVVCAQNNKNSPLRSFNNRRADLIVQDLINEFLQRAEDAGEKLAWSFGRVDQLAVKTVNYKDFQTVAKALCDIMNNTEGAGKFDILIHTDAEDFSRQIIDIIRPRGGDKNIIIKYPADGVYKLWSTDFSVEETADYASEVLVAGSGQVGDNAKGEMTAKLGTASNEEIARDFCYWRVYLTESSLESQTAVNERAKTLLKQRDFSEKTPSIKLVGRPIQWGAAENFDNGLAVGDSFYFEESGEGGASTGGRYRIVAMETDFDDLGVETVTPKLKKVG